MYMAIYALIVLQNNCVEEISEVGVRYDAFCNSGPFCNSGANIVPFFMDLVDVLSSGLERGSLRNDYTVPVETPAGSFWSVIRMWSSHRL